MSKKCEICGKTVGRLSSFYSKTINGSMGDVCEECYKRKHKDGKILIGGSKK